MQQANVYFSRPENVAGKALDRMLKVRISLRFGVYNGNLYAPIAERQNIHLSPIEFERTFIQKALEYNRFVFLAFPDGRIPHHAGEQLRARHFRQHNPLLFEIDANGEIAMANYNQLVPRFLDRFETRNRVWNEDGHFRPYG